MLRRGRGVALRRQTLRRGSDLEISGAFDRREFTEGIPTGLKAKLHKEAEDPSEQDNRIRPHNRKP